MLMRDPVEAPHLPNQVDRRKFCLVALAAGTALAASGVLGCGGGAGMAPAPPPPPPTVGPHTTSDTKLGLLGTPDGTTRDYRDLGNFFLLKDAGGIYAMTAICTHMGCTVAPPVGTHITCPCHGSQYDLDGANLVGPATLPLGHFAVTESTPGGALVVNTAQTVATTVRLA